MKTAFFSKLLRSLMTPPVTAESLTAYYASIPDAELERLDPKQLTPLARPIWQAEMDKRAKFRRSEHARK